MSDRELPLEEIVDAVVTRIRSKRLNFSPEVNLVEIDDEWNIPATADEIQAELPAVLVALTGVPMGRTPGPEVVQQELRINLHYLCALPSAGSRYQAFRASALLAAMFASGDVFDDFPQIEGAEIEEIEPTNVTTSQELMSLNIAWGITSISIKVHNTI